MHTNNHFWSRCNGSNLSNGYRIITADETEDKMLKNLQIFHFDSNNDLLSKIYSDSANISENEWILENALIKNVQNGLIVAKKMDNYLIFSTYDHNKINNLFKNFDTISFTDLILRYKSLQTRGYNKTYLDQNLNTMLAMPFFLFIMTALGSILTMNTLKKSNNFVFIVVGLIACVLVYYFKDLSLALGQTNRIPLSLAAWIPIITIGLFSSVGILQINEK